jgi:hypothetical protein
MRPGLFQRPEGPESGGGNPVPAHEILGECLTAFQSRGRLIRAENLQAVGPEQIHQSAHQRRFRSDYGQVRLLGLGQGQKSAKIIHRHRKAGTQSFHPGVSGSENEGRFFGRGRQFTADGMLATAISNDEDFHGNQISNPAFPGCIKSILVRARAGVRARRLQGIRGDAVGRWPSRWE